MEEALSKAPEGQERLGRAKDRLDTKVAEMGQAEIDEQTRVGKEPEAQHENLSCSETSMMPRNSREGHRGLTCHQDR